MFPEPSNTILDAIRHLVDTNEGTALLGRLVAAVEEAKMDRLTALEIRARDQRIAEQEAQVEAGYRATHDRMANRIITQPSHAEQVAADMERIRLETEDELKSNPVLVEQQKKQRERNLAIERIRMQGITDTEQIEKRLAAEGY